MRDLLILGMVVLGCLAALRRPWIGVMVWTWLSIMNPHRYAYGIAYDAPLAAMAAAATLLGLLMTKERASPFKGSPAVILCLFCVWMTISWLAGLSPEADYEQWSKVMKINFMIFIALSLLSTKQHTMALAWVCALSLGVLGAKGGVFTISTGGSGRVWGPPGSFIADNNEFALALIMSIPLLRFLQLQVKDALVRHTLTLMMLLCAAAALGTQSRGALIAISAMSVFLWWRGKSKAVMGVMIVCVAIGLLTFMPETWFDRMNTIGEYQQDDSAMGRFSAWWNAWGIALHYPLGVGFNAARAELFALYSPYFQTTGSVHAAHSIYFQVLGNHGFIGLFIFLALWIVTWRMAARLRKSAKGVPEAAWCVDLANLCQVSLVGYLCGGAFLSLSYFDLPYNVMVLLVLAHQWVKREAWKTEPVYNGRMHNLLGLAPRLAKGAP